MIKAIAVIWLFAFACLAIDAAVGADVPLTDEQKQAIYERETGRRLDVEALNHPPAEQRQYSVLDQFIADQYRNGADDHASTAELLARGDERQRIISTYFMHRSSTIRIRHWSDCRAYVIAAIAGAAMIGAIGWIISGFAVKRGTP